MYQFNKLEELLKANGIEYEREDRRGGIDIGSIVYFFHQLRCPNCIGGRYVWDVIYANGSFGEEDGLLELYGTEMDEPLGYMTAEECLKVIKEKLAKEQE